MLLHKNPICEFVCHLKVKKKKSGKNTKWELGTANELEIFNQGKIKTSTQKVGETGKMTHYKQHRK